LNKVDTRASNSANRVAALVDGDVVSSWSQSYVVEGKFNERVTREIGGKVPCAEVVWWILPGRIRRTIDDSRSCRSS